MYVGTMNQAYHYARVLRLLYNRRDAVELRASNAVTRRRELDRLDRSIDQYLSRARRLPLSMWEAMADREGRKFVMFHDAEQRAVTDEQVNAYAAAKIACHSRWAVYEECICLYEECICLYDLCEWNACTNVADYRTHMHGEDIRTCSTHGDKLRADGWLVTDLDEWPSPDGIIVAEDWRAEETRRRGHDRWFGRRSA